MILNSESVETGSSTQRPDGIALTFVVSVSESVSLELVLERIIQVWRTVAGWGRWCDEDSGDWPDTVDAMQQLPVWFAECLTSEPDYEVTNWMDDLHDRDWIRWNGATMGQYIKIDLKSDSLPISTWTLQYVIEKAGGTVKQKGEWMADIGGI